MDSKTIVTETDNILGARGDYIRFFQAAALVAWNTQYLKGTGPRNFTQFWDIKAFPEHRTLDGRADYSLEIALVADGVDPKHLYPLDVDRAFRSLERIKPLVTKWAVNASQLLSLLVTGEVALGFEWLNRIKGAKAANAPVDCSLDQVLLTTESLGVVKGTRHKEAAMKFLSFVLRPDRQAAFCSTNAFFPGNAKAISFMSADDRKWLPDMNSPDQIVQNEVWWAKHDQELQVRFNEFLLK